MLRRPKSFNETVTAAVQDISEHGFDSEERITFWSVQIREAADREAKSPAVMEQMLRDGLGAIYKKLIDKGEVARFHPGVARFTLEKIRPHLRAELDRRIKASADLIKLNRTESINKTMQRFRGWSTSIPKGGSRAAKKSEERSNIKKPLASLPFEVRRVLIDQGHKLRASISEIIAKDSQALAAKWHSHWRQAGYDYREDHKERDNVVYAMRSNWAFEKGLMKVGPDGYYDEITSAGEEPFCRCYIKWIYSLRDLPKEMLTAKGREVLKSASRQVEMALAS